MRRALAVAATVAALMVGHADHAHAASCYFANSIYSERNLSVTTANPARSGTIYSLGIGKGGYGAGFYAPMGCQTTWRQSGGTIWFQLAPGHWGYYKPDFSYVVKVNC